MAEKKPSSKIDKSILIVDGIASEQHLLEAIVYGENRESALKKAEKIIECLIDEHEGHYGFIEQLSKVIKNNPIGPLTLFAVLMKHTEIEASYRAKVSASIWHSDNPKQNEKKFVFQCWQEWKENPARYSSKAAFARDMLDKCEHLTSQKKIEDWCREWDGSLS